MDMGLFTHQPRRVTNGIQKSKNWMLKSIARVSARRFGGSGASMKRLRKERRKYTIATAPSAEKDTIGRRTMPNHL
jgi:3-methyladenine DNA glycosylase AlkD